MGKAIKSMTLEEAKAYKSELKASGKELSTSKEMGKVEDLIKTLQPEKYGKETVASAYSKLSSGVTTTGGWTEANLDKIEEYTGKRPQLTDPNQLPDYLSGYQDTVFGASNAPALRDSITKQLEPKGGAPKPISRVKEFEKMREEYGVADLEKNLTELKTALETEVATSRQRTHAAEGGQVAMGVIAGRVGEVERQQNERIDIINRQLNTVNDQLNTAYNVIQTYINYMGLDYNDAVNAYNTEFNRNLQIYQLVEAKLDKQQAAARANLQVFTNAITSGNIKYSTLSADQKSFVNKLELQSGLPIGFTAQLKTSDANGKVLSTTTRESGGQKYADIVMQLPDGSMKVVTQQLGAATTSGTGDTGYGKVSDKFLNDSVKILEKQDIAITGKFTDAYGEPLKNTADQLLSRDEMNNARNQIISLVGNETEGKALFQRAMASGGYGIWEP